MGLDPDEKLQDPDYVAKLEKTDPEMFQRIQENRSKIEKEIEHTVDFAYFHLKNDAFMAMRPELEIHYFDGMAKFLLAGNAIDDDGLLELCDCLLSSNCRTLRELDLSETDVKDKGIMALIEVMRKCTTIMTVKIDGCKEISQDVKTKLEAALRKNKVQTEAQDKLDTFHDAAKKMDFYDAEINYVGKGDRTKLDYNITKADEEEEEEDDEFDP